MASSQPASTVGIGTSKGLLTGLTPEDVTKKGLDIFAPHLTVEDLWGINPPSGGALLDAVLQFYGDGTHDVPWFFSGEGGAQCRTIEKSPLSRDLQESTVMAYKDRILKESISQVAAGDLFLK